MTSSLHIDTMTHNELWVYKEIPRLPKSLLGTSVKQRKRSRIVKILDMYSETLGDIDVLLDNL